MQTHKQTISREEIIKKRKQVLVDQMRMSVGELMSLYENDEINLSPDYQRLFRWSDDQQSDFIESILLGYPVPPIFVYQDDKGKWDVVDGVQRLSTIYRFTGLLDKKENDKDKNEKSEDKNKHFELMSGRVLKNIEGLSWNGDNPLDASTKLDFRRSALNIITILDKNESNPTYEIFRRLNTGGSRLSFQEIRNILILMSNKDSFDKLNDYCNNNEVYSNFLSISSTKEVLGFKMEVLSRFLVLYYYDKLELNNILKENKSNIERFLDLSIEKIITNIKNIEEDISRFDFLINFLSTYVDYDYNFRFYDKSKNPGKFIKGFNWLVFETIVWGLCVDNDLSKIDPSKYDYIVEAIKSIMATKDFYKKHSVTVMKSTERLIKARSYSKEVFNKLYE